MTLNHEIIGQGYPVVLLHGVTMNLGVMKEICEPAFAGTNRWKRIYVDLPGHGQSPPQPGIGSQDDLLTAVAAFVADLLGDAPFALVGQSRGSYLARGLIHRLGRQVSGVALLVPGGNPSSPHPLPAHVQLEVDPAALQELPDDQKDELANFLVSQRPNVVARRRSVVPRARAQFDPEQEKRVKTAFEFSFRDSEEAMVFEGPAVIIAGRQDCMSGFLDAIDLMHRFPRATLGILDAAGHGAAFERPDLFAELMRDWLRRLDWQISGGPPDQPPVAQ